ncbi:MAG: DNA ligase D [Bdellovibrionaceae bacterium]|nr:DNA ligase D [Bdellovibrionales bacterium]MCB9253725.1 DNA ligase D [Pseudobdellovibrionaceae bacterium]
MSEQLKLFRSKRAQNSTPEPFGGNRGLVRGFVVQRHAARRLHYDLRLEWGGSLHSWAVPKGPSLNPTEKRLAVRVEDHPLEYAHFEGVIPPGNYGAGTVIVWDIGSWRPLDDPERGVKKGKLVFELFGYKLKGRWALVRIRESQKDWLLIKEKDGYVDKKVVLSDRSIFSGLENRDLQKKNSRQRKDSTLPKLPKASGKWVPPMLAATHPTAFDQPGWIHELKYDGYRVEALAGGGRTELFTRNGNSILKLFPEIHVALKHFPSQVLLDGELVVLDRESHPAFNLLQSRFALKKEREISLASVANPATLFCFDLLELEGRDLRGLPLHRRRKLLSGVLADLGPIRFSPEFKSGVELFASARAMRLEGIVSKKADSLYLSGRSDLWRKIRCDRTADFAVLGYTQPKRGRSGFGSLLLGALSAKKWVYAGRVGTGFNDKQLGDLRKRLDRLRVESPVTSIEKETFDSIQWVKPQIVVEVRYKQWKKHLRQASFLRLRTDKKAKDCQTQEKSESLEVPEIEAARVEISHPEKIFWPKEKYTKLDLVKYYESVWPWLGVYLRDRPLMLTRFPDGIEGKSFYQKDAPAFVPDWIRLERVWSEHSQRELKFFVCDSLESLRYIINMGTIPLHMWASRAGSLEKPDWSILDLDPKGAPFKNVVRIAREIHSLCDELDLPNYVKTSGGTGLHILIPLGRQLTHDQSRTLAELLAGIVVRRLPEIATTVRSPAKRQGKVYLDYLQNGWGKTIAAPLCVRPHPGAPVSMPLEWREVNGRLKVGLFTIRTALRRLKRVGDPLAPVLEGHPDLPAALKALHRMI